MVLQGTGQPTAYKIPVRVVKNGATGHATSRQPVNQLSADNPIRDDVRGAEVGEINWQATAQRLQAEMDNFRKRQQRRADEAAAAEKERLLQLMLPIADNLVRALDHHDHQDDPSLRQGVELIHRELMRVLEAEGVTRLESVGHPFTPDLHEAIATVPADAAANTVVEEVEPGYKLGDKLLRPARVVVAI